MPRAAKITQQSAPVLANPSVPKGWRMVRFGDVVNNISETVSNPQKEGLERFVGLEHLEPRDLRIRSWGNISDGTTFSRVFRSGHVLFGKRRAYQRKAALADFAGICSGDIYVFAANERHLVPELLPFLVQSEGFAKHAEDTSEGSLSPRTKWKYLAVYEFALPSDPSEQRRIAELLAAADEAVEGWRKVAERIDNLRNSLIAGMSSRSRAVTESGGLRPGWTYEPLGSRYTIQLGKMMSPDAISGVLKRPYMRNANVQWNRLDLSDVAEMHFDEHEVVKFELKPGDILACEGRHVGKSAIWRDEIPGACFQKALHRLRPKSPDDLPEYLLLCLWDCELTGRFKQLIGETTIPHLPAERFRELYMAFPPREEQAEFVELVRQVEAERNAAFEHANRERGILEQLSRHLLTPPEMT